MRSKTNILRKTIASALAACMAACMIPAAALGTVDTVATSKGTMQIISGSNRYETSAQEALTGWGTAETAIIVSGEKWPDALAASSLAGALDCPLMLTEGAALSTATSNALVQLAVKQVIIVGGDGVVSEAVVNAITALGITDVDRLYGSDRYGTQLKIFEYGRANDLWSQDGVIVACGAGDAFADALSASPLAFSTKYPIFLTGDDGTFTVAQELTLLEGAQEGYFKQAVVLGGTARVSEKTEGYLQGLARLSSGNSDASTRIAGENRYETSAAAAAWGVSQGYLQWAGSAFASGSTAFDALGGGAMQGHSHSALLLVDAGYTSAATSAVNDGGGSTFIKILGGEAAVSSDTRTALMDELGLSEDPIQDSSVSYRQYNITLEDLVNLELQASAQYHPDYTYEQIYALANPDSYPFGTAGFYQFAILSDGYSGAFTAEQLNAFIDSRVTSAEKSKGVTSNLRGTGAYFIEAAKLYNINEVYLLAHAALESGWGTSALCQGTVSGYEGYYNFFGIGAYDSSANSSGGAMAKKQGWDTIEKAIIGAGQWISNNYINATAQTNAAAAVSGAQNTLYKMRFDVVRAETTGSCYHQYATGDTWANSIATIMNQIITSCGRSTTDCGLRYEVPKFK